MATTKIAIVVREDLAAWQRLNVTAFLASGVAAAFPSSVGEPYEDGSGTAYLPMFGQPVLIYAADLATLTEVRAKAVEREFAVGVYTEELFTTGNDEDNRAAVRAVPAEKLRLVGLSVHGPRNAVDKVLKGLSLHP